MLICIISWVERCVILESLHDWFSACVLSQVPCVGKNALMRYFECDGASVSEMSITYESCSVVCGYEVCSLSFAELA